MTAAAHPVAPGWQARLELEYTYGDGRTVLTGRRHTGPLLVQKPFYPEGADTCHSILIHPPGGIADGDHLTLCARVGTGARALITTPGAGKWYRSLGRPACQRLEFAVADQAILEWLPQETIIFDRAHAHMASRIDLAAHAVYAGCEVICLGRQASGERYTQGSLRLETEIWRAGVRLWSEYGHVAGGHALLDAPVGLAGASVYATLVIAGREVPAEILEQARSVTVPPNVRSGITALPRLLLVRCLGQRSETLRQYCLALWTQLRPWYAGRAACAPRIWRT